MFTAKNLTTNEENRFESRDQLLFFLDKESVALRSKAQEVSFHLEHIDQNGVALENTTVAMPLTESADAFLINFGKAASKSGFHLPKLSLTVLNKSSSVKADEVVAQPKKQAPRKPVSAPSQQAIKSKGGMQTGNPLFVPLFLTFLVAILALGLTSFSVIQINHLKTSNQSLQRQLTSQEELANQEHDIDVFVRYFLPNYYSDNDSAVFDFLSPSLQKQTVKSQKGTLQSVILKSLKAKAKGKTYQVTYVLAVKEAEETHSVKITFNIAAKKSASYGYVVTSQPKQTQFPK